MTWAKRFDELEETRWGRFQHWLHYALGHKVLYPLMPKGLRWKAIKAMRRWMYGPNANYEDLQRLLQEAVDASKPSVG